MDKLGLVSSSVANYVVAIPASFWLALRSMFPIHKVLCGILAVSSSEIVVVIFFYLEICNQMAIYVPTQRLSDNIVVT